MESVPKLSTPEEELAYLREQVSRKGAELPSGGTSVEREQIVSEEIRAHHAAPAKVLAPEYRMNEPAKRSTASQLLAEPDLSDSEQTIPALQKKMEEKGVKNVLAIVE